MVWLLPGLFFNQIYTCENNLYSNTKLCDINMLLFDKMLYLLAPVNVE